MRVLKAAIVLAIMYALGVAILVTSFTLLAGWDIRDLAEGSIPFAILLGVAFVVLAVARRIGFVLLWLVLLGLWVSMLLPGVEDLRTLLYSGTAQPFRFVWWSMVAAPLFVLSTIGADTDTRTKIGRWSLPLAHVIAVVWVLLATAGFILRDHGHPHFPWVSVGGAIAFATLGWLLWVPMPPIIAGVAVRAFWVRSRHPNSTPAA